MGLQRVVDVDEVRPGGKGSRAAKSISHRIFHSILFTYFLSQSSTYSTKQSIWVSKSESTVSVSAVLIHVPCESTWLALAPPLSSHTCADGSGRIGRIVMRLVLFP
jgi:hypothetical protein